MTITRPTTTADPHRPFPPRAVPVEPKHARIRGAGINDITLDGNGFWGRRQRVNADATLTHCLDWMSRLGWLENFDRVARGDHTTERAGWQFSDSEVYKLLEAMTWELARRPDPRLEDAFHALVARVAAAQDHDGYIGTAFGHPGLPSRYSDLAMGHELYNIGHLLQAAVARFRTSGSDLLVTVAKRAADHVCDEFGPDGRALICGHPEIEVGLAELGRALNEDRYLSQARLFIDRRGHGTLPVQPLLSADYFQDDIPVRDASVLRGHAVRALYLSAAATDVAVDDQDTALFAALRDQWDRTVERRTYITGGMGSRHQDEGFGDDFELPPDRAYCETCAGVASIMFSWRLFLATGEVKYVDLIERTLFNVIAASPRADGRAFFYANPLQLREPGSEPSSGVNSRAEGGMRAPWFNVSCCPTNVARTLASFTAYVAADDDGTIVLLQYASGRVSAAGGTIDVATSYPDDGLIRVTVVQPPPGGLRLRIPSWAAGSVVHEPGGEVRSVGPGWYDVSEGLEPGDVVELRLPVGPRFTHPDFRVDAIRGTVAIEKGPLVLCLESIDLLRAAGPGATIDRIEIDATSLPVSTQDGARVLLKELAPWQQLAGSPPFHDGPRTSVATQTSDVELIPYHRWAERGPSTMRVFLPLATG